jgi:hypothetical protein
VPPPSVLSAGFLTQQSITRIDPTLRAPYMMQAQIGVDRALPGRSTISVNLINSRGVHSLITRDVNAPLPGSGALPFPGYGLINQYETTGIYKQTQAIVNMSTRASRRISLNGYYALGFAHGDTNGQPMNPYNLAEDYGRTRFDVRHRAYIGGTVNLPYGINAAPFVTISSGSPFNITNGNQFNGDQIFNARPSFAPAGAACSTSGPIRCTPWGTFNLNPAPGERVIPVNYGEGPGMISMNIRLSRTWGFGEKRAANPNAIPDVGGPGGPGGPEGPGGGGRGGGGGGGPRGGGGGGGGRGGGGGFGGGGFGGGGRGGGRGGAVSGKKYSLNASLNARNFINHVNLAAPNGDLTSPFFGQSTSLAGGGGGGFGGGGSAAGNRRIEIMLRLSF